MADHSRLSTDVTIAHTPDDEKTFEQVYKPRQPEAYEQRRIVLSTEVVGESLVAEGGMAVVYRAADETLRRPVAMKVLKPDASEAIRASFDQEARLMARLDHPGIVGVYGLSAPGDPARIFTMKLVEGHTLAEIIDRASPPRGRALAALLRSVLKMCETLAYAHDRAVVHRDLKPENVMLGRYGECYIMDWGVAIERGAEIGRLGEVVGTPAFMAPEQARGDIHAIDERTDVYGLGAILYYIITGQPPSIGETLTEVLDAARHGRLGIPELATPTLPIPARLSDIVSKALAPRPSERYQSAMELHDEIEQFLFTGEWFTRRRVEAGVLIVREGERGDRAYIVEEGRCEVFRAGEDGGEVSLREIGPGEVIGELALFTPSGRTASIRSLTPMVLLEVTREALDTELPEGSWTRQIFDTLAARFVSMDANKKR